MAKEKVKIWRASPDSSAAIIVKEDAISLTGSSVSALEVNAHGVGIVGKSASFGMSSSNIRTGGMFVMQEDFLNMIPSTLATPMPQRLPFPPLGFGLGLVPAVIFFFGALAATSAR